MQSGENIYDAYINDSDLIADAWRINKPAIVPTGWKAKAAVPTPVLDLEELHRSVVHNRAPMARLPLPINISQLVLVPHTIGSTTKQNKADLPKRSLGY